MPLGSRLDGIRVNGSTGSSRVALVKAYSGGPQAATLGLTVRSEPSCYVVVSIYVCRVFKASTLSELSTYVKCMIYIVVVCKGVIAMHKA